MNREKQLIKAICKDIRKRISIKMGANAVYSQKQILNPLVYASVETISVEAASGELKKSPSSDDVLYHLRKQSIDLIQNNIDNIMSDTISKVKKRLRISRTMNVTIAIDYHEIPYYGDKNGKGMRCWVVGSKAKNGTSYFIRYATVDIVCKGVRFTLFALPMTVFKTKIKAIDKLVGMARKYVHVDCVLIDRGFCNIDPIKELQELDTYYIVPKIKDKKTKREIEYCLKNNISSVPYHMGTKKRGLDFNLIVYKDGKDVVAFATNKPTDPKWTAEMYRHRWGIETGYRVKKDFRAMTTSTSHTVRVIYFLLSVALYNLWVLCNLIIALENQIDWITENYRPPVTTRTVQVVIRRIAEA